MQVVMMVNTQSAGLMTIEALCNAVEYQFSITVWGLMYILPGKLFYVYIKNSTANLANLPKHMIVASLSNNPNGIIHTRDDYLHKLNVEGPIMTQCHKFSSDSTVTAVFFKPPERHNEQVYCHNTGKEPDKNLKTNCCKDLSFPRNNAHIATNWLLCS